MEWVLMVLAAYLVGSIPCGLIFGKLIWKKDLRRLGSRNIGATNAWRVIGKKAGIFIFVLDFIKGQIGAMLGACLLGTPGAMVLGGFFAIIGHIFPIFAGFRGGKGVATGLGVIAALMPKITLIVVVLWLAIVLATRYVSIASISAALLAPILAAAFKEPGIYFAFALAAAVIIVFSHRENLRRLREGRENKI